MASSYLTTLPPHMCFGIEISLNLKRNECVQNNILDRTEYELKLG